MSAEAGAKTPTQRLYCILADLEERTRRAKLPVFADELRVAMALVEAIDPDADADAEFDPGVTYSG